MPAWRVCRCQATYVLQVCNNLFLMQGPYSLSEHVPAEVCWEHLACLGEDTLRQIAEWLLEVVGLHQHALSFWHSAVCAAEGLVRPLAARGAPAFAPRKRSDDAFATLRAAPSPNSCGGAAIVRVRHAARGAGRQGVHRLCQHRQSILGEPCRCPVSAVPSRLPQRASVSSCTSCRRRAVRRLCVIS